MGDSVSNVRTLERELALLSQELDAKSFKAFWERVKRISSLFMSLKPIDRDARERLWSELGRLCEKAKASRSNQTPGSSITRTGNGDSARASYETRVIICRKLANVRLAQYATTRDQVESARTELYECLEMMRADWRPSGFLNTAGRLLPDDRDYCWDVWRSAQEIVKLALARLYAEGQRRHQEWERKHGEWVNRQHEHVSRWTATIEHKRERIRGWQRQISDLEDRIDNSRNNPGYVSDARGWIAEKRQLIRQAEEAISELTGKIRSVRDKLAG